MKVNIQNVGVIQNSSIDIKGLTVITGENNSGKTTVGKVLFSLFSSKENLYEHATADIIKFSKRQITEILRNSIIGYFFRNMRIDITENHLDLDLMINAYRGDFPEISSIEEIQDFILLLCEKIELLNLDELSKLRRKNTHLPKYNDEDSFNASLIEIIEHLQKLTKKITQLSDFDFYEKTKILKTLTSEFNNQITPVKLPENKIATISLDTDNEHFQVKIDTKAKKISSEGYFGFDDISNVIFIDDITILDNVSPSFRNNYTRYQSSLFGNDLSDVILTLEHKFSLIYKLSSTTDIVETIIDTANFEEINAHISDVIRDDIVIRDGEFVCSADNLDLANLAMGAKMFAILQMLLTNGNINNKTLLILDEPEAHLHPLWQNKLAEIIVLLNQKLGTKMVITSHSSNFILALQTYAIKHKTSSICDFYVTKRRSDNYIIDYQKVNHELSRIYADFAKPFSQIKAIYDALSNGDNDD